MQQWAQQRLVRLVAQGLHQVFLEIGGVAVEQGFHIPAWRRGGALRAAHRSQVVAVHLGVGAQRQGLFEAPGRVVEAIQFAQQHAALAPRRRKIRVRRHGAVEGLQCRLDQFQAQLASPAHQPQAGAPRVQLQRFRQGIDGRLPLRQRFVHQSQVGPCIRLPGFGGRGLLQ